MRKYFQITFFLGLFFLLVIFRRINGGGDEANRVSSSPIITQQPTPTTESSSPVSQVPAQSTNSMYKDGSYSGAVEDAYYGNIQVQVTISGGKLTDVTFLQYPNDNGTSLSINQQAMPLLRSEAIQAQSANVDIVSGASDSSIAFQKSLGDALQQAKA